MSGLPTQVPWRRFVLLDYTAQKGKAAAASLEFLQHDFS
jgi:hypothetical protein